MTYDSTIEDPQLGMIWVRHKASVTRFIFRMCDGELTLSAPLMATRKQIVQAIDELRPRLLEMVRKNSDKMERDVITPSFRIEAPEFSFWSEEANVLNPQVKQQKGQLVCLYPPRTDFLESSMQQWLTHCIEESLRVHAQVLFAPRLRCLADSRHLNYQMLKINKSRGRWGSCSGRGNINLSLFLMLLPLHLQEYVMQHELTHLVEMNHSPRFWALLDDVSGGKSDEYRSEMRKYDTNIFTLQRLRK